jgi:hypothetical protein
MKNLIQVHSKAPKLKFCSCCDETVDFESNVWYKELEEGGCYFKFNTYLSCCKDKIGIVVDSFDDEEYYQVVKIVELGGHKMNQIKGYVKSRNLCHLRVD